MDGFFSRLQNLVNAQSVAEIFYDRVIFCALHASQQRIIIAAASPRVIELLGLKQPSEYPYIIPEDAAQLTAELA